jgi:SAM-dependent methyltransferase
MKEAAMNDSEIRQAVTDHYGARARRVAQSEDVLPLTDVSSFESCCVPSDLSEEEKSFFKGLYAQDEVAGLPPGALDAAAGCGNPNAIAELRPGEVVLDLGSGGGIDCFLASRQVGSEGRVIGVDMTTDMIDLARKNARDLGARNVEFRLGQIEKLPVADSSVDLIISNCVINLSTDKGAVFREAARVLRPGGRLRVSDMVWLDARPEGAADLEEWAGCIAGALPLQDFLSGLSEAGLVNARAHSVRRIDDNRGLASALIAAERSA